MFSVGGRYYTGDPIVYSYMEDRIFEHSRNISIKLHHRIGKFVKLRFNFASRWIMISEITFDSGKCCTRYSGRSLNTVLSVNPTYEVVIRNSKGNLTFLSQISPMVTSLQNRRPQPKLRK